MKIIKNISIVLILLLGLNSCEKDSIEKDTSLINEVTIKNGRLVFQSKESFTNVYQQYADASDEKIANFFHPLYEKGYYSLRPVATEANEEFLYNHYIKLINDNPMRNVSNRLNEDVFDYLDDLEDIIGDDAFAAFLNNEAEIQIADDVYKYTDVGLFISKEDKYNIMTEYLDSKNISRDLVVNTDENAKTSFFNEMPCTVGGNPLLILTAPEVLYYNENNPINCPVGSYGYGSNTPTPGSPASTDPSYLAFLNNLAACTPHSGLFGNFFGDNNVCIDRYENRRRVKTKAFNYNYFLVYHLGVKCVHQYKGWTGFCRVEATDEIRLFVEAAQFEYDADALLGNTAVNNLSTTRDYYLNNQKITYNPNNININGFNYTNLSSTNLPEIFQNDGLGLTFEFYGTGWSFLDGLVQNGIDSNLNAARLNEHFYNGLYNIASSQLQSALSTSSYTPPANRTFAAKFPENGKIIIQKAVLIQGFNVGVAKRTFDWGGEISFTASQNGEGSWNLSGGQGSVLVRPKNLRVKMIGAARRGSGWHGSKFNVGID